MISLGRHLGSLLLGLATTAVLLSGLAVALPIGGLPAQWAGALGSAVQAAAIDDAGARVATDRDTVATPVTELRTVPRAAISDTPATTPATASDSSRAAAEQTPAPTPAPAPATTRRVVPVSAATDAAAEQTAKPTGSATGGSAASGPAAAVIAATNAERAEAGCDPVRADSRLTAAAQGHASDMARNDYFSHTDQDGGRSADRIDAAGFDGSRTAENIAYGQDSAAEVVADWMDSSGHRQNILNCAYDRIGVGYDSRGGYWVQNFGG